MATGCATANLGFRTTHRNHGNTLSNPLVRYEAWHDRRRTAKILSELVDHALHDIGLSRGDVEGLNEASWQ